MAARVWSKAAARHGVAIRRSLLPFRQQIFYKRHVLPSLAQPLFAIVDHIENRHNATRRRYLCQGQDGQNGTVVETPDGVVHFRETRRVPYSLELAFAVRTLTKKLLVVKDDNDDDCDLDVGVQRCGSIRRVCSVVQGV